MLDTFRIVRPNGAQEIVWPHGFSQVRVDAVPDHTTHNLCALLIKPETLIQVRGKVRLTMNQDNCAAEGLTYEHCVELMPEWQGLDLKIRVLTGGITNKLYRVQLPDGGDYVIRVYRANTELFIDRDMEMESIRKMEPTGIVPRLVKYLPERNATIVTFIPGTPFTNADFRDAELLEAVVRPIKLIHV